jgi:hypothetical protein
MTVGVPFHVTHCHSLWYDDCVRKDRVLNVRVSEADWLLLKRKAALESRTLSQYVRVLLARAMKGDAWRTMRFRTSTSLGRRSAWNGWAIGW